MAILWVNNLTGNDGLTKAQVAAGAGSLAFLTVNRALWGNTNRAGAPTTSEAASAGDTVYVVNTGTYYPVAFAAGDEEEGPGLIPCNSGTSGNRITIEASGVTFGSEWVELRPVAPHSGNGVFGARAPYGTDANGSTPGGITTGYITWKGFLVDENQQALSDDWPYYCHGVRNVTVEYCKIIGDKIAAPGTAPHADVPQSDHRGDNHNAYRFQATLDCTVRNCHAEGFYNNSHTSGINPINGNAMEAYYTSGLTFEHNYVTDCYGGAFWKAPNATNDGLDWGLAAHYCRFNTFNDLYFAIEVHRLADVSEAHGWYGYQNLFTGRMDAAFSIRAWPTSGEEGPVEVKFFNNTIYLTTANSQALSGIEAFTPSQNYLFANNIFVFDEAGIEYMNAEIPNNSATFDNTRVKSDRNCFNFPTASSGNFLVSDGGNLSYANWKALPSGTNLMDPNSIITAPVFVDAAGGNFRLASNGQAHLTLGRSLYDVGGATGTTIPIGCYITGTEQIGIESVAASTSHKKTFRRFRRRGA